MENGEKKEKIEKFHQSLGWMNVCFMVFMLLFMWIVLATEREKFSASESSGILYSILTVLSILVAITFVTVYQKNKKVEELESREWLDKQIIKMFRSRVQEAIITGDAGQLENLMEIGYAFNCAVDRNNACAFEQLLSKYRQENLEKEIEINFSHMWMGAARLGHVPIMKVIYENKLCDKDFQLLGKITAGHLALDQPNPKVEVLEFLESIGANLSVRTIEGVSIHDLLDEKQKKAWNIMSKVPEPAYDEKVKDDETKETPAEETTKAEPPIKIEEVASSNSGKKENGSDIVPLHPAKSEDDNRKLNSIEEIGADLKSQEEDDKPPLLEEPQEETPETTLEDEKPETEAEASEDNKEPE